MLPQSTETTRSRVGQGMRAMCLSASVLIVSIGVPTLDCDRL
jgi:hypothetical protein